MERDRMRAVRFSSLEIQVLMDLIKTQMRREKRIDCSTWAVKGRAWRYITSEFRAKTSIKRTELQLWKKWKNLKNAARKYDSVLNGKDKQSLPPEYRTQSPILEEVLNLMRQEREVVFNVIKLSPGEIKKIVEIPTRNAENFVSKNAIDRDRSSSDNSISVRGYSVSSEKSYTSDVIEEGITCPVESNVIVESQQIIPNALENQYIIPEQIDQESNAKNILDHEDNISIQEYSVSSEKNCIIGSSLQPETQPQPNVRSNDECCSSKSVLEKELALKSAQLTLLEKENQIKDLDVRIREEQLSDIIILRNHEQELHELKKQRIQLEINSKSELHKY